MVFITLALFIIPFVGSWIRANIPDNVKAATFENRILAKVDESKKSFLLENYQKVGEEYVLKKDLPKETESKIESTFAGVDYNRFFSLFKGTIIPNNWWPILFVVLAGLSGYIYSFGFFKLAKFSAHFWVPYTNVYLAIIPFVMIFFGQNVTGYQIVGAVVTTAGLMVGVSDYKRNKVEEIEKKYK